SMQVDDQGGRPVQRAKPALAQSVAAAVRVESVIRPAVAESKRVEGASDESRRPGGTVVRGTLHEHRRCSRMRLHVIGFVAEALEAHEVMERLPDHSGDRDLGHHPEHDNLRSAHQASASLAPTPRSSARSCNSKSASANAPATMGSANGLLDRSAAKTRAAKGLFWSSIGSTDWTSSAAACPSDS